MRSIPTSLAEFAAVLMPPERLAASGVGPDEDKFRAAVGRASSLGARRERKLHEHRLLRRSGQNGIRRRGTRRRRGRPRRAWRSVSATQPDASGCDAAVDFTTPDAAPANVHAAPRAVRASCVVGTTGWDPAELGALAEEKGLRLFVAPNFSIGAVLLMRFARDAAEHFPRAEIIELHNEAKKDAPSGTAKATAALVGGEHDDPLGALGGSVSSRIRK